MSDLPIFDVSNFENFDSALIEANIIYEEQLINKHKTINDLESNIESEVVFYEPGRVGHDKDDSGIYDRLKHFSSMGKDESHRKYDCIPCVNDNFTCDNDCQDNFSTDFLENGKHERMFCSYRLSKIYWIDEVLELYKNKDNRVIFFIEENKKAVEDVTLFFQEKNKNFMLFFRRIQKGKGKYKYFFITAYPVVVLSLIKQTKKKAKMFTKFGIIKK